MEEKTSRSFLHIIQSTLLSLAIIIIVNTFITYQNNHTLQLGFLFSELYMAFLFYISIASFIFSGIFYYLNTKMSLMFYLTLFFFGLWAALFILSTSVSKKSTNEIPDIMDGLSEYITITLIKFIFIILVSNFTIVLKNWYLINRNDTLEN